MNALLPSSPADVWGNLRRLYPVYNALAREFTIETAACLDLEDATAVPTAEAIAEAEKWFAAMDAKIQIQHLRQFVQTSPLVNQSVLKDLLIHNTDKKENTAEQQDKVDFLVVQTLSELAPASLSDQELSLDTAAGILEPVLGPIQIKNEDYIGQLEGLLRELQQNKTLKALFTARVIERGRQIKDRCGDTFFEPLTMAAFARFGFLMRRTFFRLMHQDLNAILDGLRQLETRGVSTLDCRKAQFSAEEPINRLRMICQSWKVMFQAEYSAGQPLCILVDLRTAVEAALKNASNTEKARAAAASAEAAVNGGSHNRLETE
jgi:hypothetical protein